MCSFPSNRSSFPSHHPLPSPSGSTQVEERPHRHSDAFPQTTLLHSLIRVRASVDHSERPPLCGVLRSQFLDACFDPRWTKRAAMRARLVARSVQYSKLGLAVQSDGHISGNSTYLCTDAVACRPQLLKWLYGARVTCALVVLLPLLLLHFFLSWCRSLSRKIHLFVVKLDIAFLLTGSSSVGLMYIWLDYATYKLPCR